MINEKHVAGVQYADDKAAHLDEEHALGRRASEKMPYAVAEHAVKDEEIEEGEDIIRAHDEFTEKEYSKLMLKVDLILMVSSRIWMPL